MMFINIDEISKERICSIRLENNNWHFYDCNYDELPIPSEKRIFSSAMKNRYQKERKNKQDRKFSTVWILVGTTFDNVKKCVQVGRTKDLINSLTEIKNNIKDFYCGNRGKYDILRNKNYKEIVFYEVNIDEYIKNKDELFKNLYGDAPDDEYLLAAYYFIRAAYVEGKLGAGTNAFEDMYHKSSLDEYFFDYYKKGN